MVQRRDNYGEEDQQSFNQPWEEYKQGFGNPTKAFWLGNENIFMLTNTEDYQLRIELEDFDGETRWVPESGAGVSDISAVAATRFHNGAHIVCLNPTQTYNQCYKVAPPFST